MSEGEEKPTPEEKRDTFLQTSGGYLRRHLLERFFIREPLLQKAGFLNTQEYQEATQLERTIEEIIVGSKYATEFKNYMENPLSTPEKFRELAGVADLTQKERRGVYQKIGTYITISFGGVISGGLLLALEPLTAIGLLSAGVAGAAKAVSHIREYPKSKKRERRLVEELNTHIPLYREALHEKALQVPQYLQELEKMTAQVLEQGEGQRDLSHLTDEEISSLGGHVLYRGPKHLENIRRASADIKTIWERLFSNNDSL